MFSIFRPVAAGMDARAVGRKRFLFCFLALDMPLGGLTLASTLFGVLILVFMSEITGHLFMQMVTVNLGLCVAIDMLYTISIMSGHQFWVADNWANETERVVAALGIAGRTKRCWHLSSKQWRCQLLFRPSDAVIGVLTLSEFASFVYFVSMFILGCETPNWLTRWCVLSSILLAGFYTWSTVLGHYFQMRDAWQRPRKKEQSRLIVSWQIFVILLSLPLVYATGWYLAAGVEICCLLNGAPICREMTGGLLGATLFIDVIYTLTQVSSHAQWWFAQYNGK